MPTGNIYTNDDLPDLRGYVFTNKRIFTRVANQLIIDCGRLTANYSAQLAKSLDKDYTEILKPKCESLHDRLDKLLSIEGLTENVSDSFTNTQKEVTDKMNEVTEKFQAAMATAPDNNTSGPPPKAVTELKPDKLEKGFSPSQLAHWLGQLQTYWRQSRFDQLTPTDQQNVLFTCMSTQLGTTLGLRFEPTHMVFSGDDSADCISVIEQYWLEQNPILSRRLELFRANQAANQKFSSFIAHLTRLEQGCDIENISGEELFCLLLLKSCSDDTLLAELLKADKFNDRRDIEATALHYERREKNASTLGKLRGNANRTGNSSRQQQQKDKDKNKNQGSGNSNKSSNSNSNNSSNKNKKEDKDNKKPRFKVPPPFKDSCLHCGSKSHKGPECDTKASVQCSHCDSKGSHATKVCFKKYWQDHPEGSGSANMIHAFMAKGPPRLEVDPQPMMEVDIKALNLD